MCDDNYLVGYLAVETKLLVLYEELNGLHNDVLPLHVLALFPFLIEYPFHQHLKLIQLAIERVFLNVLELTQQCDQCISLLLEDLLFIEVK
jgi:hypothetical protein